MVAIVITNLGGGGAERLLVHTIPKYVQMNIPISLVLVNKSGQQQFYYNELKKSCEIINLKRSKFNPLLILDFVKLIKKFNVLHVHLFPTNLWVGIANRFSKKKCTFIHTDHGLVNKAKLQNFWGKLLIRIIYNQYDHIICITENIKKKLENEIGVRSKLHYIPNGTDLEKIRQTEALSRSLLKPLPSNFINKKLVVMTSRLHAGKRHDKFLALLSLLGHEYVGLLLGVEKLNEELVVLSKKLAVENKIIPLGFRNNPIEILKLADVNVLLSDYEGMSGVVIESLASRKPFFGSNVSGINNIVPNKEYVVDNIEELVKRIKKCFMDKEYKSKMIEDGYLKSKEFSLEKMVSAYSKFYVNHESKSHF